MVKRKERKLGLFQLDSQAEAWNWRKTAIYSNVPVALVCDDLVPDDLPPTT
jgi:hypothetical protein